MRDEVRDTVNSGGAPAPLGGGGASVAPKRRSEPTAAGDAAGRTLGLSLAALVAALVVALAGFGALATAVVEGGWLVERDADVATWVAGSMPTWAEWLARPFTLLGGFVGMTIVVTAATVVLLRRRARADAALLLVVTLGAQALVFSAKEGYGRQRPDIGSAIDLPSSFSFPSGHAATGVAVFGLLGLLAAGQARTRAGARALAGGGLALGAAIGASRVVLDVHYVSDVLAGGCLGVAWLAGCVLLFRALRA